MNEWIECYNKESEKINDKLEGQKTNKKLTNKTKEGLTLQKI